MNNNRFHHYVLCKVLGSVPSWLSFAKKELQQSMEKSGGADNLGIPFGGQNERKERFRKAWPGRWLTEKRLQHGERLLETTDLKVYETAFECGFESPSHFCRIFKEKYSATPL